MENVWTKYDKSMTSLMVLICGWLRMVFIHGKLRMVDYEWPSTHGYLRMALIKECYRC